MPPGEMDLVPLSVPWAPVSGQGRQAPELHTEQAATKKMGRKGEGQGRFLMLNEPSWDPKLNTLPLSASRGPGWARLE